MLYLIFSCDRGCDGKFRKFGNFVGSKHTLRRPHSVLPLTSRHLRQADSTQAHRFRSPEKKTATFPRLSLRSSPRSYCRYNLLRLIVGDLTTPAGGGLLKGSRLSSRSLSLLLFPAFYHRWTRLAWGGGPSGSGPASISASVGEQTLAWFEGFL